MRILGLLVLLFTLGLPIASAQDDPCYAKNGFRDETTGDCIISRGLVINIQYPTQIVGFPDVEAAVDNLIAVNEAEIVGMYADLGTDFPQYLAWELSIDYSMRSNGGDLRTIYFLVYTYTGGAHGLPIFTAIHYDDSTGQVLAFDDVFVDGALEVISPLAQAAFLAREDDPDNPSQITFTADDQWLIDGTAPTPENYATFAFTPEGIEFTFQVYQVTAYAAGPQTIVIPYEDLASVLQPGLMD